MRQNFKYCIDKIRYLDSKKEFNIKCHVESEVIILDSKSFIESSNVSSKIFIFKEQDINDEYVILESCNQIDSKYFKDFALCYALSIRLLGYKNIIISCCNISLDNKSYIKWQQEYIKKLKKYNITESNIKYTINNNICSIKDIESKILLDSKKLRKMKHFLIVRQVENILKSRNAIFEGKFCVITGINEISLNMLKALNLLSAKVVAISDKNGFIYEERGIDVMLLLKIIGDSTNTLFTNESFLESYAKKRDINYIKDKNEIWNIPAFAYFLNDCSMQINNKNAQEILRNGCKCVVENTLNTDFEAIKLFLDSKIVFTPFILNFSAVLFPTDIYTNFENLSEKISNHYEKIIQNAISLQSPTNLLLATFYESKF